MRLLIRNANVITMNPKQPRARALVVEGNRIALVGGDSDLSRYRWSDFKELDAGGSFVLPGFIDSHLHMLWMGYSLLYPPLDLSGAGSIDRIVTLLKDRIDKTADGIWIIATGLDEDHLKERRSLTRHDLDAAGAQNPVIIRKAVEHSLVANSLALQLAAISMNTPDPHGGYIERDDRGMPTGGLFEKAMELMDQAMPKHSPEDQRKALSLAMEHVCTCGITSVVSNDDFPTPTDPGTLISDIETIRQAKGWAVRMSLEPDISRIDQLIAMQSDIVQTGYSRIGPLKIFADGALFTRTAALEEDYSDAPGNKGMECFNSHELQHLIDEAHKKGFSVAVHAIGDRSIKNTILAIESTQRRNLRKDVRHRIVHCSLLNNDFLRRMREQGIIADIQPSFLINEWQWVPKRIGERRVAHAYRGQSFLQAGVHVVAGSDAPSEPVDPLLGIYGAMTRQNKESQPQGGWKPEERMTLPQALLAYTHRGAFGTFEEDIKGSIEPGKLADLVVIGGNILSDNPKDILDARCLLTLIGGQAAYISKDLSF